MGLMSLFAWFALSGSIICTVLAVIVYFFNRKGLLNRIFIYTILFGGYCAFTSLMVLQADNVETAYFWNKVGFMWPFFLALLFQFTLVFTENRLATNKRRYILLYLPAAVFALLDLTTNQLSGFPVQHSWGFILPGSETLLCTVSSIWSISLSCTSVLLCARYYFKVDEENKKSS